MSPRTPISRVPVSNPRARRPRAAAILAAIAAGSVAATGLAPAAARAEEPLFQLPPVVASASRLAAGLSSSAVTVIDRQAIDSQPGRTLPEIIASEANLHLRDFFGNGAASFSTLDIRGFGEQATQNTLILVDGRRINDFDLSGVQTTLVPREDIVRIEVIRGAVAAVLYGEGAVGGAINIVTRAGAGGQAAPGVQLAATGGSLGFRRVQGSFRVGSGPASFALSSDVTNSEGYRRNNELIRQVHRFAAEHAGDGMRVHGAVAYNTEKTGLPGGRLVDPGAGLNELASDPRGTSNPDDEAERRGFRAEAGLEKALGAGLDLVVDAGYRRSVTSSDFVSQFRLDDRTLTTLTFTPRVLMDGQALGRRMRAIAGVDVSHTDGDVRQRFIGFPGGSDFDGWQTSTAIFGQADMELTPKLVLDAGLRLIHTEVELESPQNPSARERDGDTQLAANLGLAYDLDGATRVFLRGGRAVRVPTLDERVGTRLEPVTFLPVSFALDTQTSWDVEAGIQLARGPVDLRLSAFQMHVKDQLAFFPDTLVTFGYNTNLDRTRRRGIEAEAVIAPGHGLRISPRLTWIEAEFTQGPFKGNDIPAVPPVLAGLGVYWEGDGVWLAGDWRYVSEQRMLNDQQAVFPKMPSYSLTDLSGGVTVGPAEIKAQLRNLFDEDYYTIAVASDTTPGRFAAYPLPGRTAFVEVSVAF